MNIFVIMINSCVISYNPHKVVYKVFTDAYSTHFLPYPIKKMNIVMKKF